MKPAFIAFWSIGLCVSAAAQQPCRSISDSLERLRCYDALPDASAAPPPPAAASAPLPAPTENPAVAKARTAIKKLLRDPNSARFEGIKVKTVAGKTGVCGQVNSKNAMGGMTGPKIFVFDGTYAHILVDREGPENGTSFDNVLLGAWLKEGLEDHDKFCK